MADKYVYWSEKVNESELSSKLELVAKMGWRLVTVTQSGSQYTLFLEQPEGN